MRSAVLFIVFHRIDTVRKVFAAIRRTKPPRLYIAADGPRLGRDGELKRCNQVRELVSVIDWPCELKTLFQDINLGPRRAQVTALNWFFMHEEEGIILEDDCLPAPEFFGFCEEMLDRYRENPSIFMVSGNNFQGGLRRGSADYYFSCYPHIWGWATWKRTWQLYDNDLEEWPELKKTRMLHAMHPRKTAKYWESIFDKIHDKSYLKGWDYRFTYTCWSKGGLAILPNSNLVKNIGFGPGATNCTNIDSEFSNMNYGLIDAPYEHPSLIERDVTADALTSEMMFVNKGVIEKLAYYLTRPSLLVSRVMKKVTK